MGFNDQPKNLKKSINDKYNRRVKSLSRHLEDFIYHAEMKLDESISGRIYRRSEIESIVEKVKELMAILPASDEPPSINFDILEIIENATEETQRILSEGQKFFDNLSPEELAEMISTFQQNKKDSESE
ncbi:hypothetical protein [Escherichia coli]|uniref:Uncharacterized protein n=2 Tax=Escherichia coli TaxID=562 RepID=B7UP26_ECO27|nr:hypothetical protein [Escherichia coli]EHU31099.1 hypothetical protein ECDEC1D_5403 [Escherichia coli DEC1D]MCU6469630.1 hypothetical protein [Escherichia coli]CAS08647.1 predicted protein [Escherichia coli O127:H6 str. E2348/69]CTU36814.1 Uncharacterised protein [Escherichia coli]CTV85795.1 Uncharacterised protein [Escherichia coli]